jgi:hypothetical protein
MTYRSSTDFRRTGGVIRRVFAAKPTARAVLALTLASFLGSDLRAVAQTTATSAAPVYDQGQYSKSFSGSPCTYSYPLQSSSAVNTCQLLIAADLGISANSACWPNGPSGLVDEYMTGTGSIALASGGSEPTCQAIAHHESSDVDDTTIITYPITATCPTGLQYQNGKCVPYPDRGVPPNACPASPSVADPISVGSGAIMEDAVDFMTAGPQPLRLKRYYSSISPAGHFLGDTAWKFDFEYLLSFGPTGRSATLTTPQGETYQLSQSGNS